MKENLNGGSLPLSIKTGKILRLWKTPIHVKSLQDGCKLCRQLANASFRKISEREFVLYYTQCGNP